MSKHKIFVIGDIHGMYDKLMSLFRELPYNKETDYLIFLGDYIDRGEDNYKVLQFVYNLSQQSPRVICLLGNHEQMLLEYLQDDFVHNITKPIRISDNYIYNGGDKTLQDLQKVWYKSDKKELSKILHWIKTLRIHFQIQNIHFAHAGINPQKSLEEQTVDDMIWIREKFLYNYNGSDTWFVGHTPVQALQFTDEEIKPLFLENNIVMMDTGSYMPNGKISCYEITEDELYESK